MAKISKSVKIDLFDRLIPLSKSIGVSNYNIDHLQELLNECRIKPHVNQVEVHPHYTVHEGAFYQLFVRLSSATSFEPIFGNIDVPLGIY